MCSHEKAIHSEEQEKKNEKPEKGQKGQEWESHQNFSKSLNTVES